MIGDQWNQGEWDDGSSRRGGPQINDVSDNKTRGETSKPRGEGREVGNFLC